MLIKVKKGKAFMANRKHFTDRDEPINSDFFGKDGVEEAQRLVDGGWCDDVTPEPTPKPEPVKVEVEESEPVKEKTEKPKKARKKKEK